MKNSNLDYQDIYLDVNHVWQEDPEHHIPPNESRRICAIAAMKVVIDYLPPESDKSIKLAQIREWLLAHNGLNSDRNWLHSAQVDYLTKLSYTAWRRNWNIERQDASWLVKNENYSAAQESELNRQIHSEEQIDSLKDKVSHSLIESFRHNCPVIVSVKLGFDTHGENHQIVLNGYKKDNEHDYFYYTDPIDKPEEHSARQKITTERFYRYFNYLAIFTKPA